MDTDAEMPGLKFQVLSYAGSKRYPSPDIDVVAKGVIVKVED